MGEVITFFQNQGVYYIFKGMLLILMLVYALFTLIVYSRVRALNRTIYIAASRASTFLQFLTALSVLVAVSLFVITLVIV